MNNKSKQSSNLKVSITPELEKSMNGRLQQGVVDYVFTTASFSNGEEDSLKREALPRIGWILPFGFFGNGMMSEPVDLFTQEKRMGLKPEFTPFRYTRSKQGKLNARRRKKRKDVIARLKRAGQVKHRTKK